MANLTRKTSKSKSRSRRAANMKLQQNLNLVECPNCHQKKLPHRVCKNCGFYDGRDVLNISE
ncbi:MAG: 50S ribosomal protein L32 [Candidatus Goldbacteria bacterium]|nr:50S ribosomal protein L32 [Candidatus Goldiibacteriota bacterium]HPD18328.1 50S ribosomal protein L32 [Candidatus Goldiibacteriota bacterium]